MRLPKPNRINFRDLISNIKKGYIRIPRFQRDFVWKLEDTAELLDSILKGYPIGTFILWITRERMASIKELGGELFPDPHKNDNIQYVLDGQQRIASLFVVYEGNKHKRENKELDYRKIYVNLDNENNDEDIIISTKKKGINISVYELLNKDLLDFEDKFDRKIREKIQEYKKIFDAYEFSIIEVRDFSLDSAVEIFTRINTTGTVLTLFEIMVAKTYDEEKKFDMQKEYEKFQKELKRAHYDTIRPRNILNILALIINGECTRKAILSLEEDEIINKWYDTLKSIQCSVDFLRTHLNIPVSELLPYDSLIVPISYFYYKNKFKDPSFTQEKFLKQYFWLSSLSHRFTSATNSKLKKDSEKMDFIIKNKEPIYDFKVYLNKEDIKNLNFSIGNSFCKAILCLFAQQNPSSFKNGSNIILDNSWLKRSNSKNYHHFFPKGFLKSKGISKRNSIVNITLINERINLKDIKDNAPSKYMKEFYKTNPKFKKTLNSHLIDDPSAFGIWNDDYNEFLEKRAIKIVYELNKRIS